MRSFLEEGRNTFVMRQQQQRRRRRGVKNRNGNKDKEKGNREQTRQTRDVNTGVETELDEVVRCRVRRNNSTDSQWDKHLYGHYIIH